jgi:PAS domain-containing protein
MGRRTINETLSHNDIIRVHMKQDALIAAARNVFPDCEYIVDLYDLSFLWSNPQFTEKLGYPPEEVLTMRNIDMLDKRYDEARLRKQLIERVEKTEGENDYILVCKDKHKVLVCIHYHAFEFNKGWYIAGKLASVKPISDDEALDFIRKTFPTEEK